MTSTHPPCAAITGGDDTEGIMYAGIDGCRAGWVLAGFGSTNRMVIVLRRNLIDLLDSLCGDACLVLIDLPIGLPGEDRPSRSCDREVRRMLGQRASSVFPVLCRAAVHTKPPDTPKEIQRRIAGTEVSQQALALVPSIAQLDEWIRANRQYRWLRESHPELAFCVLNGLRPLRWSKHDLLGGLERLALLAPYLGDVMQWLPSLVRRGVGSADLMDAMVLAVHAREGFESGLTSIPAESLSDSAGLRMEMVYARRLSSAPH